jgi:hypothetical protein
LATEEPIFVDFSKFDDDAGDLMDSLASSGAMENEVAAMKSIWGDFSSGEGW